MHICYIYIYKYLVLEDIGLTFDNRFFFRKEDDTLYIEKTKYPLPENFWGPGIYSLTGIVGDNGAGKTTALRLMKKLFVEGEPRNTGVDVLVVYENKGELFVYNPNGLSIQTEEGISITPISERKNIRTLYYSGHFQPYTGAEGEMELAGSYDASDSWMLIRDLLDYSNVDTIHLTEPIYNHLSAYYAQNNYRICELLLLEDIDKLLYSLRLPKYVIIAPNMGGWNAIKLDHRGRFEGMVLPKEKYLSKDAKGKALERIIYYDIVNLIAEEKLETKIAIEFLDTWLRTKKSENVDADLDSFVEKFNCSDNDKDYFRSIAKVISIIAKVCDCDTIYGTLFIDIRTGADDLRRLVTDILRKRFFLTARFFDIFYGHELYGSQRLSSGELEMLNLLSRLYYGITLLPQKIHSKEALRLLLLDEAEIGFHPEWQRQYVKIITEFMNYMMVKGGVDFQIVVTSHSPIILSDLPVSCINFLHREGGATYLKTDESQTFGENVFQLYRRAFFMKDGLVGEFAISKLKYIQENISDLNNCNVDKMIALIGDERIRKYFMKLRDIEQSRKMTDEEMIQYYQGRIDELRQKTNE